MLFSIPLASRPIFLGSVTFHRGRMFANGNDYTNVEIGRWSAMDWAFFLVCPD